MSKRHEGDNAADRREFLKLVSVAGAASALPFAGDASGAEKATASAHAMHDHKSTSASLSPGRDGYEFFNTSESAFIEAAVDTLIPADAVGPGALELGVATYIDRQMAGSYGKGDRLYLVGPFGEGSPQQGYQLAMTPSELIRIGIADVNGHTQRKFNKTFEALSNSDRTAVITELDDRKVDLPNVPTATFFGLLLQLTIEGYFADPMYGGNKNKASWKMIGFPGASAMYMDKIESFRNRPYTAEPLGIQDLA
jgi:gluconate 2-dehydrogenase gamma chain